MVLEKNPRGPRGLYLVAADVSDQTYGINIQPALDKLNSIDEGLGYGFKQALAGQEVPSEEHFLHAIQMWIMQNGMPAGPLSVEFISHGSLQTEMTRDVRGICLPVNKPYILRIAEYQMLEGLKGYVLTINELDFTGEECTLGQLREIAAYEQTSKGVWEEATDLKRPDPTMLTRALGRRSKHVTDLYAIVSPSPFSSDGPGERVQIAA